MVACTASGDAHEALAINEVSLLRQSVQAAHLQISVNGVMRLEQLVCDGALVATPAGSTAYNLSAHGPVLPLGSGLLALTPISPFRPRRWRGALLPHDAVVELQVLERQKRPVAAGADSREVRDVDRVIVREDRDHSLDVLFDRDHSLEERILREQFL
jgi:NAD+ kinase